MREYKQLSLSECGAFDRRMHTLRALGYVLDTRGPRIIALAGLFCVGHFNTLDEAAAACLAHHAEVVAKSLPRE